MHHKRQVYISLLGITISLAFYCLDHWVKESLAHDRTVVNSQFNRYHTLLYSLRDTIDFDQDFKAHLENGSKEASKGFLKVLADSIGIDGNILIWDKNCELVASAIQGIPLSKNCQHQKSGAKTWSLHQGVYAITLPLPQLDYVLEVLTVKGSVFQGKIKEHINEATISPHLQQEAAPLLVLSTDTLIYSSRPWVNFWYRWCYSIPASFWLILTLFFATILGFLLYAAFQKLQDKHQSAQTFASAILKQHGMDTRARPCLMEQLKLIEQKLLDIQMTKHDQLRHLEGAMHQQSTEINQLESLRLDSYFYNSLQQQMNDHGQQLVAALVQWGSQAEDINDTVEKAIYAPCHQLLKLLRHWQTELGRVSARKFFRTLSERTLSSGKSQLDHETNTLIESLEAMFQNCIQLRVSCQKLSEEQVSMVSLADYWLSLVKKDHSKSFTIAQSAQIAQSLVMAQNGLSPKFFINQWEEESSTLDTNPATWNSCLLHIYKGILWEQKGQHQPIYTRLILKDRRFFLIITSSFKQKKASPLDSPPNHHIALAQKIISSTKLQFLNLPHEYHEIALAITWSQVMEHSKGGQIKMAQR